MKTKKGLKVTAAVTSVCLVFCLCACGTLMYPERKGFKSGSIDPTVAILDGVGCLFFLIPGLVMFAVDFHNGTIYLPPGETSSREPVRSLHGMTAVHVGGDQLSPQAIESILEVHTGKKIDLGSPSVRVVYLGAQDEQGSNETGRN